MQWGLVPVLPELRDGLAADEWLVEELAADEWLVEECFEVEGVYEIGCLALSGLTSPCRGSNVCRRIDEL